MTPLTPVAYYPTTGSIVLVHGRRFDRRYVNVANYYNSSSSGTVLESKLIYLDLTPSDLAKFPTLESFRDAYPHYFI